MRSARASSSLAQPLSANHQESPTELHGLWVRPPDATGNNVLVSSFGNVTAPDWSHDGRHIVLTEDGGSSADLWVVSATNPLERDEFLKTRFWEAAGVFSPNDRWIAYQSDVSGQPQVYVRSFPKAPGEYRVSRDGGTRPRWRADGKEIFFLALDGWMMAASVEMSAGDMNSVFRRSCFSPTSVTASGGSPWPKTDSGFWCRFGVPHSRSSSRSTGRYGSRNRRADRLVARTDVTQSTERSKGFVLRGPRLGPDRVARVRTFRRSCNSGSRLPSGGVSQQPRYFPTSKASSTFPGLPRHNP